MTIVGFPTVCRVAARRRSHVAVPRRRHSRRRHRLNLRPPLSGTATIGFSSSQPSPAASPAETAPAAETPRPPASPRRGTPWQRAAAAPSVPETAASKDGWDAFERGDYQTALSILEVALRARRQRHGGTGRHDLRLRTGRAHKTVPGQIGISQAAEAGSSNGRYRAASIYAASQQCHRTMFEYKWLPWRINHLRCAAGIGQGDGTVVPAGRVLQRVAGPCRPRHRGGWIASKNFKPTP